MTQEKRQWIIAAARATDAAMVALADNDTEAARELNAAAANYVELAKLADDRVSLDVRGSVN